MRRRLNLAHLFAGRCARAGLRRDPRAECRAAEVTDEAAAPRPRRDPRQQRRPLARAPGGAQADAARAPIVIENPAAFVVVVPDLARGRIDAADEALLHQARSLADRHEAAVLAVLTKPVSGLETAGVDRVLIAEPPSGTFAEDHLAELLETLADRLRPRHFVLRESGRGGDIARRLAARLGEQPATGIVTLDADTARCATPRPDLDWQTPLHQVLTFIDRTTVPPALPPREARVIETPAGWTSPSTIVDLGTEILPATDMPLEHAPLVMGAGRGVRDLGTFAAAAGRLGAAAGATRMLCDAGLMPRERQIGASGRAIAADCYLAFGISGAVQHMQGLEACGSIVAVNTDPHAPIMKEAALAVVADADAVLAALAS